jgi:hypothetical protein
LIIYCLNKYQPKKGILQDLPHLKESFTLIDKTKKTAHQISIKYSKLLTIQEKKSLKTHKIVMMNSLIVLKTKKELKSWDNMMLSKRKLKSCSSEELDHILTSKLMKSMKVMRKKKRTQFKKTLMIWMILL